MHRRRLVYRSEVRECRGPSKGGGTPNPIMKRGSGRAGVGARRRPRRAAPAGRPYGRRARSATARRRPRPPRPARSCEPSSVMRPSSTTATRSASWAEKSRCAIATTVRPSSTAASDRSRCRAARGSMQRRGLVEHQRVRVGDDQPRQRELLRLCRRQRQVARAEFGVEPVRQLAPPSPTRRPRPGRRAPARRSTSGRANATFSRSVPRNTWCSCVTSATCRRSSGSGSSTSGAPPTVTVPVRGPWMPGEQPAEGGLAGAGRPDHGQPLARRHRQRDPVQDVSSLHIGVTHVGRGELLAGRLAIGGLAVGGHLATPRAAGPATPGRPAARPATTASGPADRSAAGRTGSPR